jgi:ankyrin repeat protein
MGASVSNDSNGDLPLHCASSHNCPLKVIEALYNAYPDGAHQKNNDSKTPLDLAVENGASPEVVAFLQDKGIPSSKEESSSVTVKAVDKHETAEYREESDQFTGDKTTRCEKADICRAISNR